MDTIYLFICFNKQSSYNNFIHLNCIELHDLVEFILEPELQPWLDNNLFSGSQYRG